MKRNRLVTYKNQLCKKNKISNYTKHHYYKTKKIKLVLNIQVYQDQYCTKVNETTGFNAFEYNYLITADYLISDRPSMG